MFTQLKKFILKLPLMLTIYLLFVLFGLIIIFHSLILLQVIPYEMTWGGNLKTLEEMYLFESISIIINTLMIFVVFLKRKLIISKQKNKTINAIIWVMAILFLINTLGNLTAKNILEFAIATPITLILSILCFRLNIEYVCSKCYIN